MKNHTKLLFYIILEAAPGILIPLLLVLRELLVTDERVRLISKCFLIDVLVMKVNEDILLPDN
jgi:hypothetical protein